MQRLARLLLQHTLLLLSRPCLCNIILLLLLRLLQELQHLQMLQRLLLHVLQLLLVICLFGWFHMDWLCTHLLYELLLSLLHLRHLLLPLSDVQTLLLPLLLGLHGLVLQALHLLLVWGGRPSARC